MTSEEKFYQKWHAYFEKFTRPKDFRKLGPRYEDDEFMDKILLIVLYDMPATVRGLPIPSFSSKKWSAEN